MVNHHRIVIPMHTKEVWVSCGTCNGRGASLDIVERENGKRIVLRRPCPACLGRGLIDIARGPVTGNDYR